MISWFVQVIKKKSVYLSFFLVSSKFWTPPKTSPGWSRCCIRLELASKTHGWNFQLCHITLVYWRIACCCIVVYSYIFNLWGWNWFLRTFCLTVPEMLYSSLLNHSRSFPLFATDHVYEWQKLLWPDEQCLWVCSPTICHWSCDIFVVQVQKLFRTKWANKTGAFFPLSPISIWWEIRWTHIRGHTAPTIHSSSQTNCLELNCEPLVLAFQRF